MTMANPGRHDDNVWGPDMHQQEEQVQTDRAAPSLPCQLDGPFLITISAQTANCLPDPITCLGPVFKICAKVDFATGKPCLLQEPISYFSTVC